MITGALDWIVEIERLGVRVLINEHVQLSHDGAVLVLAAVTDYSGGAFNDDHRSDPHAAFAGTFHGVPSILLAHQQLSAEAASEAGFDLQPSGHTHGGQFWPWNHFVPLQQPYTAGLHRLKNLWYMSVAGRVTGGLQNDFGLRQRLRV